MGACYSDYDVYDNDQLAGWRPQFESLKLRKKEISKLYNIFQKVDVDCSGTIGLAELLALMDVERTAFSERVFSIFDEDGSGAIDFREFVLALWNYCTLSSATLDLFAFDLYDKNHDGTLSIEEIEGMIQDLYGKRAGVNQHAKAILYALKALDVKQDIDAETFTQFAKTHYYLLFPAFEMQIYLQRSTLGQRFWSQNAERRVEISEGRFVPIGKFMEIHLNKALYNETVTGAVTKMDKGMNEQTLGILATTGTRHARLENEAHGLMLEDDHGHAYKKSVATAGPRATQEERFIEQNTKDQAAIYKNITAKTTTKYIDAHAIARTSSKDSSDSGENSYNRKTKASPRMNPATGQRMRAGSKDDPQPDDGNPSIALFQEIDNSPNRKKPKSTEKGNNYGRRQTLPRDPYDSDNDKEAGIAGLKRKQKPTTDSNDPKVLNKLHKEHRERKEGERSADRRSSHSTGTNSSAVTITVDCDPAEKALRRNDPHSNSQHSVGSTSSVGTTGTKDRNNTAEFTMAEIIQRRAQEEEKAAAKAARKQQRNHSNNNTPRSDAGSNSPARRHNKKNEGGGGDSPHKPERAY